MSENEKPKPVAVITGASSGIGKATALLFAKHGYRLSISGRDEEALATCIRECIKDSELTQNCVTATIGDLRDDSVARDLIKHTVDKFGQIDVLVNNAGILVNGTVEDSPVTDFDKIVDVNVRSVIQLTKHAIPHLVATKGSIVNVSSVAGTCAFPGVTYYCMSKAALDQFTKCLALELAPKSVRVNAVNPGVIVSNIHKRAGMSDEDYAEFIKKCETTHALGRVGSAEEVANGILFLASPQSSFTTGHLLSIDGGRNIMTPR
ncbi:enoyl-(Acyl carrier protein) reductase domain-containing protein [Ditylenchus destructor]|nr:enoyl-(Acyl carrier protein) reductase domain-containing protein [Ditylenchus destructor]